MSTQLLSYDQFTEVRYPRVWQWAMVMEIALTFLLLNVLHDLQTVAVVGVYAWVGRDAGNQLPRDSSITNEILNL